MHSSVTSVHSSALMLPSVRSALTADEAANAPSTKLADTKPKASSTSSPWLSLRFGLHGLRQMCHRLPDQGNRDEAAGEPGCTPSCFSITASRTSQEGQHPWCCFRYFRQGFSSSTNRCLSSLAPAQAPGTSYARPDHPSCSARRCSSPTPPAAPPSGRHRFHQPVHHQQSLALARLDQLPVRG